MSKSLLGSTLLTLLFAAGPAHADAVDDLVQAQMARQHIPGLSLAVVRDGKVVKAKGYGLANVELKVAAAPETVYQIQSITKQFTATGVMMLVEEGKIGLDDPISKYLEDLPPAWSGITVRHLLTHTSGIKDFINERTVNLRLDLAPRDVIKSLADKPLNFPPGERFAYSNTGYHLLAMIIRQVTGKEWGDFLTERVFTPLGMADTRVISWSEIIPNRAAGYRWDGAKLRNGEYVAISILGYAGGGIRSTVLDMAKWDAALSSERLLKKSSLEQMWTPGKVKQGSINYGFGWAMGAEHGHRLVTHNGAHFTGFQTCIRKYPEDHLTVVVLTNLNGSDPDGIAKSVARSYLPDLVEHPIADSDPALTERLRGDVAATIAGTPSREHYAPGLYDHVTSDKTKSLWADLRRQGKLLTFQLIERKPQGNSITYRYLAHFQEADSVFTLTVAAGKITAFYVAGD